mmetsp:Transcript_43129/g.104058  ORF Transcript_43129/g.104058 Transcript_43129/m.104058 type:complete len:212 (-) Transcript_43129:157-792(-)
MRTQLSSTSSARLNVNLVLKQGLRPKLAEPGAIKLKLDVLQVLGDGLVLDLPGVSRAARDGLRPLRRALVVELVQVLPLLLNRGALRVLAAILHQVGRHLRRLVQNKSATADARHCYQPPEDQDNLLGGSRTDRAALIPGIFLVRAAVLALEQGQPDVGEEDHAGDHQTDVQRDLPEPEPHVDVVLVDEKADQRPDRAGDGNQEHGELQLA